MFIRIRPPVWWSIRESKNTAWSWEERKKGMSIWDIFWLSLASLSWTRSFSHLLMLFFIIKENFFHRVHVSPAKRNSPKHFLASRLHRERHQQRHLDWVLASTWSFRVMCWVFQCHLLIRRVVKAKQSKKENRNRYKALKSVIVQFSKRYNGLIEWIRWKITRRLSQTTASWCCRAMNRVKMSDH